MALKLIFYLIEDNPPPANIHIKIPFSDILDRDYTITYAVTDYVNTSYSEATHVQIINSSSMSNIKLKWINVIYQVNTNEILHEKSLESLSLGSNIIDPNICITFVLENNNVAFKETNNQECTTKINPSNPVNLSNIFLKN